MQHRDDAGSDLLWIYSSQNVFQIAVAGVTLLLYDHALTFSEEVRLVWKAPWNFAKALFLFVRYYAALCVVLRIFVPLESGFNKDKSCRVYVGIWNFSQTSILCLVDLLILLRVYALWERSKRVLALMIAAYLVAYAVIFYGAIKFATFTESEGPACFGEGPVKVYMYYYVSWAFAVSFDTLAFVMTCIMGIRHWKSGHLQAQLLKVFYRDGAGHFIIITALKAYKFIGAPAGQNLYNLIAIGDGLLLSIATVIVTRMFLNLRSVRTPNEWAAATSLNPQTKTDSEMGEGIFLDTHFELEER